MYRAARAVACFVAAMYLCFVPTSSVVAAQESPAGVVAGASGLGGVACESVTTCVAVGLGPSGQGVVVSVFDGAPGAAVSVPGTYRLEAVACTSPSACLAVGQSSSQAVVVPIASGVPGPPIAVSGADGGLYGVACPTTALCLAVGFNSGSQGVVVPIMGGVPGPAQAVAGTTSLAAVACASSTMCYAVGGSSVTGQGLVVPIASTTAGQAVAVDGVEALFGIACPSVTLCHMSGVNGTVGVVVSYTNGSMGVAEPVSGSLILFALTCPSSFLCETVGLNASGQAIVSSISDGVPAAAQVQAGAAALIGVACPTSTSCVSAGANTSSQGVISQVAPAFTLPYPAFLTYPLQGQTGIDTTQPFRLAVVPGAQGYLLVVGSRYGSGNLFNSGVLSPTTSAVAMPAFPPGIPLYATLFTETNNNWGTYTQSTFTAAPGQATFTNPLNGQVGVSRATNFTWSTIPASQGTILTVGTTPYGTNIINSGILNPTRNSYYFSSLPAGVLYANLLTKVNGAWTRYQHIVFTVRL